MYKWELKPCESIGPIKFGMDRSAVRKIIQIKCVEFQKSKYSKNTTDDFGWFHVFYTTDNKVDAVEIFEGIEIIMDGIVIFPIKTSDILNLIPDIEEDNGSYTHVEKSIGIEADSENAESILVGSEGYYK